MSFRVLEGNGLTEIKLFLCIISGERGNINSNIYISHTFGLLAFLCRSKRTKSLFVHTRFISHKCLFLLNFIPLHICWILIGIGTRCGVRRSCKNWDVFIFQNCVQILATWCQTLLCCNMRQCRWMNGMTNGFKIPSQYLCTFKLRSIKCSLCLPIP